MKNFWTMIVLAGLVALVAIMPAAAQNTFNGDQINVKFLGPDGVLRGRHEDGQGGAYHISKGMGPGVLLLKADKGKDGSSPSL